eukprot:gene30196-biopygen16056
MSKTADAIKAKLIDVDALWSSKRIVVYTPTISAGVDFSTEHFGRMYLYLCPGSAAAMGALQMTGRVRHLVDTDVRTLVAKNMQVAREATRQHLTHVDLYQWLRWMEGFSTCSDVKHVPTIDGGDDHTLQELSGGALALLFATVAPPTLKMNVESYFLAEIYNASFDYVSCFADLLEHAGHRMDLGTSYAAVSAARVHGPAEGDVEATSEFLLRVLKAQEQLDALTGSAPVTAPDTVDATVAGAVLVTVTVTVTAPDTVTGPVAGGVTDILSDDVPTAMRRKDLMDAIEQRVMANDASEDDKFLLYLSRYCSAWGIDRVDEAFLLENKPGAVGSPKARLLSRLLCPILRPVRGADVHTTEHSGLLKIVLVEETLDAMGFSSPFDTTTVIPNLMTAFDAKLKGTQMELEIMEVYEDFEMPGRATVSRNPYQAAMDDVMCSVFCERSVVHSASKTLFNLHYLSVTDELVPHDAMSSGRFYGGLNRILFPVIVKADPIMCEAAEPLHQFKISMMYDTGSTLSYVTLEVLHALGYKKAVYPPDPKLPHSEHMYEVCISGISTQVGLCPKTRCEHVCLLGQQFLMDARMHVAIDYVTRTACMKRS